MTAPPYLYQQPLGARASVVVTHNYAAGSALQPHYAGNLALHVQDDANRVLARRTALEADIGVPVQWLNQVHGVQLATFSSIAPASPTADASLTSSTQWALGILTADCLPVAFAAADGSAVAAAHAGWRGLLNGVLIQSWQAMRTRCPNGVILAHLGPCIGAAQFEVSADVRDAFVGQDAALAAYCTPAGVAKFLVDLCGIARHQLRALGAAQITGGGWCTVSDPRLASYRRSARLNQPSGRFATLVRLLD